MSARPFLRVLLLVLAALAAAPVPRASAADDPVLDFGALLDRVVSVEHLAEPLRGATRRHLFSGTDPAAAKAEPGSAGWFANDDRGHVLRSETTKNGVEHVLAEVAGAGVVARLWSDDAKGTWRIYVDDALLVEAPGADFLGGATALAPEPLAGRRGGGYSCYLPIPFARSLKVTSTEKDIAYQIDVQGHAAGRVAGLTADALRRAAPVLAKTARKLRDIGRSPTAGQSLHREFSQTFLLHAKAEDGAEFLPGAPRQTALFSPRPSPAYAGLSVVTDLQLTEFACHDAVGALGRALIVIEFDGVERVRAPLGAFFACGPRGGDQHGIGAGLVKPVPGWRLFNRFPMPFKVNCTITIENRSGQDIAGKLSWRVRPAREAETLPFGVVHREFPRLRSRPRSDVNLADLTGAGHVVGVVATVRNPVDTYWGEGDEKVWIDGAPRPALWGSGTDELFGLALASTETFSHPFHGQPICDGTRHQGYTTLARWYTPDPIPFTKSLRYDLGVWHREDIAFDLTTTVFFYGGRERSPFPADTTPRLFD